MKTTVVGSFPVPDWLKASPGPEALTDAMSLVMREQERIGLDVISDGELGRWDLERRAPGGMVERFVRLMDGVSVDLTRSQLEAFEARQTTAYRRSPAGIVTRPLTPGRLNLRQEWQIARSLTDRPLKFTLTSPYMIARVLTSELHKNTESLALDVAAILADQMHGLEADVLQVDEPNLPGSPDDSEMAAEAINRVLDASPARSKAVHLCFGNYGGQSIQSGDYRRLIGFLNALQCDHLVLETTRRPTNEVEMLRDVDARLGLGLGVIDVKDLQIETPDMVARRIEQWAGIFGAERLAWVHPDCGMQVLPRAVALGKLKALVLGKNLFTGEST